VVKGGTALRRLANEDPPVIRSTSVLDGLFTTRRLRNAFVSDRQHKWSATWKRNRKNHHLLTATTEAIISNTTIAHIKKIGSPSGIRWSRARQNSALARRV